MTDSKQSQPSQQDSLVASSRQHFALADSQCKLLAHSHSCSLQRGIRAAIT